jgi:hypothetical protein
LEQSGLFSANRPACDANVEIVEKVFSGSRKTSRFGILQANTWRRYLSVRVDEHETNLIDEMKVKIDSRQGKQVYARRLGIVEPVFVNFCVQKHMNRFTLRAKSKVDVQWRLFALVHNIGKIQTFGIVK